MNMILQGKRHKELWLSRFSTSGVWVLQLGLSTIGFKMHKYMDGPIVNGPIRATQNWDHILSGNATH